MLQWFIFWARDVYIGNKCKQKCKRAISDKDIYPLVNFNQWTLCSQGSLRLQKSLFQTLQIRTRFTHIQFCGAQSWCVSYLPNIIYIFGRSAKSWTWSDWSVIKKVIGDCFVFLFCFVLIIEGIVWMMNKWEISDTSWVDTKMAQLVVLR